MKKLKKINISDKAGSDYKKKDLIIKKEHYSAISYYGFKTLGIKK